MTKLRADSKEFQAKYPNGALLFDADGKKIDDVFECDLDTGVVLTWDRSEEVTRDMIFVPRKIGVYPAPLKIVPM